MSHPPLFAAFVFTVW